MFHITRRQDATSNTLPLRPSPQSYYNNNTQKTVTHSDTSASVYVWQSESERASADRASE